MKIPFLNRVLNVSKGEWPRIVLAWNINLLLRIGFVMGWTTTIAMFINRFGINSLPFLIVLNALLIMLSTIIYAHFLQWIKKQLLIYATILMAGIFLFVSTFFAYSNNFIFFGIILIAQSILLSQLNILIALFIEDLFSPFESQRAFPLIASAETLGGIIGGLAVGIFVGILPAYKFIYLWILALLAIIPIFLASHSYHKKLPYLKVQKESHRERELRNPIDYMKNSFFKARKNPFLKGIVGIILMQFMLFNLLEFQYIKAIQETVTQKNPIEFELYNYQPTTKNLKVSLLDIKPITNFEAIGETIQHRENELTKNLGILAVIFSLGSLVVQILLTSRIISNLGIVNSLLIHPLVTCLNLVGMTLHFNFFTAAITRSSFEITGGIFQNAYHTSYYAISEHLRTRIKELLEGLIKPVGAVLAFGVIFLIQNRYMNSEATWLINLSIVIVALLMTLRLIQLRKKYTDLSYQNLNPSYDLPTRLNAIEILGQEGHEIDNNVFIKYLKNKKELPQIKSKILEIMGVRQDMETLPALINCLEDDNEEIRLGALEALQHFKNLVKEIEKLPFTRYRLIDESKKLFQREDSDEVRANIIRLLSHIDQGDLIPFILSVMIEGNEGIKQACIRACGKFKDANIMAYLKGYLQDKNPLIKAETIIALWGFMSMRKELIHHVNLMKKSDDREVVLATLLLSGELEGEKDLAYLIKNLASSDQKIRYRAAEALSKLKHPASIPHMVEFLMEEDQNLAAKSKKLLKRLDKSIVENIHQLAHVRVSEYICHILSRNSQVENLDALNIKTLKKLKAAYTVVDEYNEVAKIEKIIKNKQRQKSKILILTQNSYALPA